LSENQEKSIMNLINRFLRFIGLQNKPLEGKELEEFQKSISPALRTWGHMEELEDRLKS
jgi:hypothetical protein